MKALTIRNLLRMDTGIAFHPDVGVSAAQPLRE
jgi:hypothetical protein